MHNYYVVEEYNIWAINIYHQCFERVAIVFFVIISLTGVNVIKSNNTTTELGVAPEPRS